MQKQSPGGVLYKDVLKNFAKFTVKHQCQSLFLNKVAVETLAQVFSCEFLRTPFLQNTSWRLFLPHGFFQYVTIRFKMLLRVSSKSKFTSSSYLICVPPRLKSIYWENSFSPEFY